MAPPWDRGKDGKHFQMIEDYLLLFIIVRDLTTKLAPQCRAFSRDLKIEKLKAPLFPGPDGSGIQMTGALKVSWG